MSGKINCRVMALVAGMWVTAARADTLELRVVTDGGASAAVASPVGGWVDIAIQGKLASPGATAGLALWAGDLVNTGTIGLDMADADVCVLVAPAGMVGFDRDAGWTSPGGLSAYGGTGNGQLNRLLQIGGGQNTMNNTAPAVYPVGVVTVGVANTGTWTNLATGSVFVSGQEGQTVVLNLERTFASTINSGQAGPFYAITPALTDVSATPLTITVEMPDPPEVEEVWSWGYHGSSVASDLGIRVYPYNSQEGRSMVDALGNRLYLEITFDQDIATVGIATNPVLQGLAASIDGETVTIEYAGDVPADEVCYAFDLAGTMSVGGSVVSAGRDFCVCYNEADVDRNGSVNAGDKTVILWSVNYLLPADQAANLTADIDRSGVVNAGDRNLAVGAENFLHSPTPCPE